ncbi:unnamed protein product [Tuber melanosporum]|uniref:(Perigord truffle) hypothetical protein n=1 Tax=Tuber melanosporum (strain Mel28) TaxID=656061 RepID=D5G7U7_TUBMM|nr:uncharacterized protein GSTUM_00002659001 [Tuber melanosporum]CAZ80590.1 unnamed protein product [Tuber melanosporum]
MVTGLFCNLIQGIIMTGEMKGIQILLPQI